VPGVRNIAVTNQVFKVETTVTERDSAMTALRSDAFNTIAHHAYRPKDAEGTVFYLTDKIIVQFDPKATSAQIDRLLEKYKLKVHKEYEGEKKLLVEVTSGSGENPIKIANRLAEEALYRLRPNMAIDSNRHSFLPMAFKRQWHLK
jgi:hypothetical protein